MCNIYHEKDFTQNVANVTFVFGTSPNIKPEEKKWGDLAYYIPPPEKVGEHVPVSPHQIGPMSNSFNCEQNSIKKRYYSKIL